MATSPTVQAWRELYAAQTEATGEKKTATIGTRTGVPCVVSEMRFDQIIAYGGKAESGGFEMQIAAADLNSTKPAKLTAVTHKATTLKVQAVADNNGIYYITAFDPVEQE